MSNQSPLEAEDFKEAAATMNAVRKWNHSFHDHRFTLTTDQRAVSFALDPKQLSKSFLLIRRL